MDDGSSSLSPVRVGIWGRGIASSDLVIPTMDIQLIFCSRGNMKKSAAPKTKCEGFLHSCYSRMPYLCTANQKKGGIFDWCQTHPWAEKTVYN